MTTGTGDEVPASGHTDTDHEPLARYLARTGRLPVFQGLALAVQLLSALEALHRRGQVQGNVSSSSLLVNRAGSLLLPAPQGLRARLLHRSPEPDIVAAAAVAYELLTGASPSRRSPAPVRDVRAELPVQLDSVFARALAARPGDRFGSAAELSAALLAALPAPTWDRSLPAPAAMCMEVPVRCEPAAVATVSAPIKPHGEVRAGAGRGRRLGLALAGVAVATVVAAALLGGIQPPERGPAAAVALQDTREEPLHPADGVELAESSPLPAATPLDVSLDATHPAATQDDGEADAPRESAPSAAPAERPQAAARKHRTSEPASRVHGREARPHAARAVQAQRVSRQAAVRVAHSVPAGPEAACRQDMPFAPALCTAFRCATSEYRQHPVCVRMHAEGALARARLAESRGGP